MNTLSLSRSTSIAVLAVLLAVSGCNNAPKQSSDNSETAEDNQPEEEAAAPVSIIRDDVPIERDPLTLEPLAQRISFDEGGSKLSAAAIEELKKVLDSPQLKAGGPIFLRGHTDSAGPEAGNLRASRNRAEAVRDWLLENRVAEDRITVIAMGEQNPARDNALPDGSPDEEGRAFNRRVDLEIPLPPEVEAQREEKPQTLVERVASED